MILERCPISVTGGQVPVVGCASISALQRRPRNFSECRPVFSQIGPDPVDIAQIWPYPVRRWPTQGREWPSSVEFGPNVPTFRPTSAEFDRRLPRVDHTWPELGTIWPERGEALHRPTLARHWQISAEMFPTSTKIVPKSAKAGPASIWPLAQKRPNSIGLTSVAVGPSSAQNGPKMTRVDHLWPGSAEIRPHLDELLPDVRPNLGHPGRRNDHGLGTLSEQHSAGYR